jgi:uncharacterized protein with ParB-like and HNH nuclease domain
MFPKLDLFSSLGEGRETTEDRKRFSFRNVVLYSYLEFRTTKSLKQAIMSVIHHRENPLDSVYIFHNRFTSFIDTV